MANQIYVVEDDTASPVRLNTHIPAFCLKGDIFWAADLPRLNELITRQGMPDFLILDNNLGWDRGLDFIDNALEKGTLDFSETIIAAVSSSDTSLILRMVKELNKKGIGAFPKHHTAEACLWIATQSKKRKEGDFSDSSQEEIYGEGGMERSDTFFFTNFGKNVDQAMRKVKLLPHLDIKFAHKNPWNYANGSVIVPESDTIGVFHHLVDEGLSVEKIRELQIPELVGHYERIRGEGTPPGQRK